MSPRSISLSICALALALANTPAASAQAADCWKDEFVLGKKPNKEITFVEKKNGEEVNLEAVS
jgi:hypothetical protein